MKRILCISFLLVLYGDIIAADCDSALLSGAKLSASSVLSKDRGPEKALYNSGGSWTAQNSDFSQYVTIDLGSEKRITAISSWGKEFTSEFVQEFRIYYGYTGSDFTEYKDVEGNTKLFRGNRDGDSEVINRFDTPIIAQYLRINPTRWRDRISMRVELYGCDHVAENMNFDGRSYVSMNLSRKVVMSTEDTIRFRFRTNNADGVLLYSRGTQRDFFALQLIGNQLLLNMDLGGEGIVTSLTAGSLLDDNTWHDVKISRFQKDIFFAVDRVLIKEKIKGDSFQLDLNREFYIGGLPTFNQDGLIVTENFTGCFQNLFINQTNIISEIKADHRKGVLFEKVGQVLYDCQFVQVIPVTFTSAKSHLRIPGYMMQSMNCSFDFRTFNEDGMLLFNKFSVEGFVKLFLEKGRIKIHVKGKNTPPVLIQPFDEPLNDGKWHATMLIIQKDRIELHIDGQPSITTRILTMQSGQQYLIGGGLDGSAGFIGCMRFIFIEGRGINVRALPPDQYTDGVEVDVCQMIDRCSPNPCEHGGICRQNWEEFTCDCSRTGYTGAVCHISRHPLSCEDYRIENPRSSTADIQIDVDGSGPLEPFPVECIFHPDNVTETRLHHKNERFTDVKGFKDPGSFIQDIVYNAAMEQIVHLVNRSTSCKQKLEYQCYNARLFDSPSSDAENFNPNSWWVSRSNQKMDYWGGSLPGSRKCQCGLYGRCKDPNRWCNCDAGLEEWLSDGGEITQKDYLPVRQLRFGDTGSSLDEKQGRYMLGPLECEGDSLFDNVVTFRYDDATIEIPRFDMRHSGDIYFQFKTTTENGVLVHSKGAIDFIKIVLVGGDQVQFQYHAGNGPLGVSVETPYKLNNNEWHSVHVERNRKEARIIVDGSQSAEVKERIERVRALNLTDKLVIGATADYKEGYVGCMRAFILSGKMVDLKTLAEEGLYGVSPGCVGKCASSPCLNNGICLEGYSGYTCDCQWTPFKGPICADEIGVNLRSDYYVRYDFETTISTLEEYIRVGFTTTEHQGMIFGMSSYTGEYLNLMMSTSGHLRLVFDFGFERQEIIIKNENFALGQIHDVQIRRVEKGSKMIIFVDNYEPKTEEFNIRGKEDAQFNQLKSIYVGRNESMGTGEGFIGCISRVQFEDHLPLRRYFQESRRSNVKAFPETVREDTCGIEPVTYPPEIDETRPPPTLPPGVYREPSTQGVSDSAILGAVLAVIFAALIIMAVLIGRYVSRHKGEYKTHEDKGAKDAPDADTAVMQGKTGHDISKKKEWFI